MTGQPSVLLVGLATVAGIAATLWQLRQCDGAARIAGITGYVGAGLGLCTLGWFIKSYEGSVADFPTLTYLIERLLHVAGYPTGRLGGTGYVDLGGGAEAFRVTTAVLAPEVTIPSFTVVAMRALRQRRRTIGESAVEAVLVAGYLFMARPLALVVTWSAVAVGGGGRGIISLATLLGSPTVRWLSLCPVALMARASTGGATLAAKSPRALQLATVFIACMAVGALGVTSRRAFSMPAYCAHGGVVMFDDYHSERWEQSARLYDASWFGDWSAYSYTSWVEWLGRTYEVRINRDRLDDDALRGVDVVVLKTPSIPYAEQELATLRRYVESGGGVLLIGDHTNLLGMNSNLNRVGEWAGITFRDDAVEGWSPEVVCEASAPRWGAMPGIAGLPDGVRLLTACSIALEGQATPLLLARGARGDKGDYGNRSFFGDSRFTCDELGGDLCVGAMGECGAGTVVAFADSTVFSNFTLYRDGHLELGDALIAIGLHRGLLAPATRAWMVTLLLAAALVAGHALMTAGGSVCWTAAVTGLALGLYGTSLAWDGQAGRALAPVAARMPPIDVAIVHDGTIAAYPEAIGQLVVPAEVAFDTLAVSLQRMGFRVFWGMTVNDAVNLRPDMCVLVNPGPPLRRSATTEALAEYVREGGDLLLLDDPEYLGVSSTATIVDALGVPPPSDDERGGAWRRLDGLTHVTAYRRRVGRGTITLARDSREFSRARLGHCFDLATSARRERVDDIVKLWGSLLPIPGKYARAPLSTPSHEKTTGR